MKKTPILLSTMIMASGGLGITLPNVAASGNLEGSDSANALHTDPLTGENLLTLYANAGGDKTSVEENAIDTTFQFLSVDYKTNRIGIQINENEDWLIRRIVVAYWDYENGVTEVEADTNLETLGTENATIWKTLWDYDAKGLSSIYQYVVPKVNGTKIYLKDNLTDIVYYGVEYGHKTEDGEWQDTWWERGKINYRNCVHSAVFDSETMFCLRRNDGTFGVRMHDMTEVETPVEEVISWNEEWNEVQMQRYNEAASQLADLRYNLYNVLKILDGADQSLARLEVTLPKTEGMANRDEMVAGNARLQTLSQTIREYYLGMNSDAAREELELLKQEKTEWLLEKSTLEEDKSRIEQENVDLRQEIARLKQVADESKDDEDEEGSQGTIVVDEKTEQVEELTTATEKVEELAAKTETKIVTIEREREEPEEDAVIDEAGVEAENADEAAREEEVVVPNLGALEKEAEMSWWWVVMTGMGILAVLSWGLSRVFGRSKHE